MTARAAESDRQEFLWMSTAEWQSVRDETMVHPF
jgi:hypothetical protein